MPGITGDNVIPFFIFGHVLDAISPYQTLDSLPSILNPSRMEVDRFSVAMPGKKTTMA
jgi:hypothetical protein